MKNFYAIEQQSIGVTQHSFESKKDRDNFVEKNMHANIITSKTANEKTRGVYVRKQHHPRADV